MRVFATAQISENMYETPEGYLVCVGVPVARTGEQLYGKDEVPLEADESGRVMIDRQASEVFKKETMASFEGKPFTIGHPTDFVGPDNWNVLAKGFARNIRRGSGEFEGALLADLLVTNKEAINLIKSGKREISCGYETEYVQTGIGRGIQKNIIGNHIALVDEGRAGSAYAINDHKGKGIEMTIKEKIKAIFAKAEDEAIKAAEGTEEEEETSVKTTDSALLKAIEGLSTQIAAFGKKAKVKDGDDKPVPKKEEKKGEDEEVAPSIEDRMKKMEDAVAGLVEKMSAKAADDDEPDVEMGDEDSEESEEDKAKDDDEDMEEEASDEDCEDDYEESTMTGDTISRIEILAPGMDAKAKDAKRKALRAAYETKDGKAVINKLTGGKAPDLKDDKKVNTIFVAASEMLKATRNSGLARTKTGDDFNSFYDAPKGAMTPEKLNEINEKHFSKTAH